MIKLLQKKEISTEESPIMLQRRHTIMEVDKGCTLVEPKLKSITRSSSTSSLNKIKKKPSEEKAADTTLSPDGSVSASNASTVVITESELSSSWLYNNKKAQMKTSPRTSPSRLAEVNDEMKSPMLPKSKIRSNSIVGRRTKKSSCCCYTMITLIIGLAALGILAAIASILYMEFFASYNITDIQITTPKSISKQSVPLKKVGHSLGVDNKVLDNAESPERASESVLFPHYTTKVSGKVIPSEKQSHVEDVLAMDKKNTVPVNETVDSSSVLIDDLLNFTSQMINSVISDQKEISNPINALFSRNQNLESHYNKLFELYQGLRPAGSSIETSEKSEPISQTRGVSNINISENDSVSMKPLDENWNIQEKVNFNTLKDSADAVEISSELALDSSMVEYDTKDSSDKYVEKDLSVADMAIKDSSLVPEDTKNFGISEIARDFEVINNTPKSLSEVAEDSSQFRLHNIIDENNIKDSLDILHQKSSNELKSTSNQEVGEPETVPNVSENMETISLKPLPQITDDNLGFLNSHRTLDIDFEEDKTREDQPHVSDPDQPLANLPIVGVTNTSNFVPKFLSQFDRTWGISNLFRNLDVDLPNIAQEEQISDSADETGSVDLNLPIQETNIAIPKPVEMIRRFGKEESEKKERSDDIADHDRRFSLAKALDRLRLLDANNILPSSRQSKTASPKKKESPKIQTDLEVATERSHYLENLRKKFFDSE